MTLKMSRKPRVEAAWMVSLGLALLASGVSLRIAIEAANRLGSSPDERLFLAGGVIVAVLGAHLLMPIFGKASARARLAAILLSMVSAGIVVSVHASVLLSVQAQASALRMAGVVSSQDLAAGHTEAPRRVASQILAELAEVRADQVRLRSWRCADDCARRDAREAFLKARVVALDAEADEVRRWLQDQDRLESRRAAVKDDPVTARLADLLGVTPGATGLVLGVLFAVMLEGTGCLCWFTVLQRRGPTAAGSVPAAVTPSLTVMPAVTVTAEAMTAESQAAMPPVTSEVPARTALGDALGEPGTIPFGEIYSKQDKVLRLVDRVRREIEAGRVRPTVTEIRAYLACARGTAAEVRRAL